MWERGSRWREDSGPADRRGWWNGCVSGAAPGRSRAVTPRHSQRPTCAMGFARHRDLRRHPSNQLPPSGREDDMTTDVTNLESMEVTLPTTLVAECRATSTADSGAISAAVATAFENIQAFQRANGITAAGPPRVVYTEWSPTGVHFTAAIPIAAAPPNVTNSADV